MAIRKALYLLMAGVIAVPLQACESKYDTPLPRYAAATPPQSTAYYMPPGDPGYYAPPRNSGYYMPPGNRGYYMPPVSPGYDMPPASPGYSSYRERLISRYGAPAPEYGSRRPAYRQQDNYRSDNSIDSEEQAKKRAERIETFNNFAAGVVGGALLYGVLSGGSSSSSTPSPSRSQTRDSDSDSRRTSGGMTGSESKFEQ